jgi:hypothetical protein
MISMADDKPNRVAESKPPQTFSVLDKLQWRPSQYFESLDAQRAAAAISEGTLEPLQQLQAKGFDWNTRGRDGVTLLWWAFLADEFALYSQILEWGADPDQALDPSEELNLYPLVRSFVKGDSVATAAATLPYREKWLVAALVHGANPNAIGGVANDTLFTTYLTRKRFIGPDRFQTIELMISKGANIHHLNAYREGALLKSLLAEDWDVTSRFLELNVNPKCYDRRDWQLVHHVAFLDHQRRQDNEKYPLKKQEWLDSPQRKDFERLVGLLAERGFPLEEAIADVKRANESVDGIPYMTWRRMQRQDKDACTEAPAPNGAAPQNDAPKKQATPKDR